MRSPTPEQEERLRERWRTVGRVVLTALIYGGMALSGYQRPLEETVAGMPSNDEGDSPP